MIWLIFRLITCAGMLGYIQFNLIPEVFGNPDTPGWVIILLIIATGVLWGAAGMYFSRFSMRR